jgi:hypothetical protein
LAVNKKSLRGTEEDCRCRDISYIWVYREVSVLLSSFRHKSLEQQNSSDICSFLYHSYCRLFILILLFSSILALSFLFIFFWVLFILYNMLVLLLFLNHLCFSFPLLVLCYFLQAIHCIQQFTSEIRNMFWIKLFIFHSTCSWLAQPV